MSHDPALGSWKMAQETLNAYIEDYLQKTHMIHTKEKFTNEASIGNVEVVESSRSALLEWWKCFWGIVHLERGVKISEETTPKILENFRTVLGLNAPGRQRQRSSSITHRFPTSITSPNVTNGRSTPVSSIKNSVTPSTCNYISVTSTSSLDNNQLFDLYSNLQHKSAPNLREDALIARKAVITKQRNTITQPRSTEEKSLYQPFPSSDTTRKRRALCTPLTETQQRQYGARAAANAAARVAMRGMYRVPVSSSSEYKRAPSIDFRLEGTRSSLDISPWEISPRHITSPPGRGGTSNERGRGRGRGRGSIPSSVLQTLTINNTKNINNTNYTRGVGEPWLIMRSGHRALPEASSAVAKATKAIVEATHIADIVRYHTEPHYTHMQPHTYDPTSPLERKQREGEEGRGRGKGRGRGRGRGMPKETGREKEEASGLTYSGPISPLFPSQMDSTKFKSVIEGTSNTNKRKLSIMETESPSECIDGSNNTQTTLVEPELDTSLSLGYELSWSQLREIATLEGEHPFVYSSFIYDGVLATANSENVIETWYVDGRHASSSHRLKCMTGHTALITELASVSSSPMIASSSMDGTIRVWKDWMDVSTIGVEACCLSFRGNEGTGGAANPVPVTSIDFHPLKTHLLCSTHTDGTVCVWDVCTSTLLSTKRGAASKSLRFQPNEGILLATALGNTANILDVETETSVRQLDGHTSDIKWVLWNRLGSHLLTISEDTIRVWEPHNDSCIQEFTGVGLQCAAFHPILQSVIVIGDSHGSLHMWDYYTRKVISKEVHNNDVMYLGVNFIKGFLASCSTDAKLKIYDGSHLAEDDQCG